MRVLVLAADLPPRVHSGIGTAAAWNVQAFADHGGDVEVLTTASAADVPGVRVTPLDDRHFPTHLRKATVIHLHSLRLAELALELRRRDGSALLYTAHTLLHRELEASWNARLWQARQRKVLEQADHVLFLSEAEKQTGILLCPDVAARSTVLRHAIPPCPGVSRATETMPLVLFAGRFCRSKGFDVAAAAMERMLHNHTNLRCILVGNGSEPAANGIAQTLARRYPERCLAPGWLPHVEIQTWMQRASLLLMPSRYEPFGMVALEALRIGLPVLGASIEGLCELLAENSGATTVAGHSPQVWADAASALLQNADQLQAMRRQGPLYVQKHYSPAAHASAYRAVLERCVAQRNVYSAVSAVSRRAA